MASGAAVGAARRRVLRVGKAFGAMVGLECVLAVAVLAVCGASAAAQGSWQPAVKVSAGSTGDTPLVAMSAAGDSVIVWNGSQGRVVAVVRRVGKAFSAPQRVSRGDGEIFDTAAAIDDAGTAIVAWQRAVRGSRTVVQAALLSADGRVSPPQTLSRGPGTAFAPRVAAGRAGQAIVTWTQATRSVDVVGSAKVVRAATRAGAGGFSRPIDLSADDQDILFSAVAMNATGDTIVAWPRGRRGRRIVQAALRPAGGSFGQPVSLSVAGQRADFPEVAIDPNGNAIATWLRTDTPHFVVQAAARPTRGAFSTPVDLSAPDRDGVPAAPAMDAAGQALVVWVHQDFDDPTNGVVQLSVRPAGGAFSPAVDLSRRSYSAAQPSLVMGASGAAIAVWSRAGKRRAAGIAGVQAALRQRGGSFSASVDLASVRRLVSRPKAAVDQSGNALVTWASFKSESDESGPIWAARYRQ